MTHPDTTQQRADWAEAVVAEHDGGHTDVHAAPGTEHTSREQLVLDRIDRARRARPRVREKLITLAHGAGGKATQSLIEAVFLDAFRNPLLEPLEDAATVTAGDVRLAFTTDSYVVSPLFFPGGNIGDLAVNGTVNDLAVSGARPAHLSAGFILEEGFPVEDLRRIVASMAAAAAAAGVSIVTGDTKVVKVKHRQLIIVLKKLIIHINHVVSTYKIKIIVTFTLQTSLKILNHGKLVVCCPKAHSFEPFFIFISNLTLRICSWSLNFRF